MDLTTMDPSEREEYYEQLFSKQVEPLHLLEFPSLTSDYPHLADEINTAYLRHTIFTVKIWINYDAATGRFFNDVRAEDCGLLRILNKKILPLLAKYEYSRVRFELCTPFTQLATILITTQAPSTSASTTETIRLRPPKRRLVIDEHVLGLGVSHLIRVIREDFEPTGTLGLGWQDLVTLAAKMRILPDERSLTYAGWIRDTMVWMNYERREEHNLGYFDVDG